MCGNDLLCQWFIRGLIVQELIKKVQKVSHFRGRKFHDYFSQSFLLFRQPAAMPLSDTPFKKQSLFISVDIKEIRHFMNDAD